jgi:hypothetical protein
VVFAKGVRLKEKVISKKQKCTSMKMEGIDQNEKTPFPLSRVYQSKRNKHRQYLKMRRAV